MKRTLALLCISAAALCLPACGVTGATFSFSIPFGNGEGKSPVGSFNYQGTVPPLNFWKKNPGTVTITPTTPETPPAVVTPAEPEPALPVADPTAPPQT